MSDLFAALSPGLDSPASAAAAITPSDAADINPHSRMLWIGGAGTLRVTMTDGQVVDLAGVPAGATLLLRVRRVHATGTTATGIVALW